MVHMAQDILEERLRWVLPIARKEVRLVDVAKVFPYGVKWCQVPFASALATA